MRNGDSYLKALASTFGGALQHVLQPNLLVSPLISHIILSYWALGLSQRRLCEVGSPQAHAQIRAKSTHPQKVDSHTGFCKYTLVLKEHSPTCQICAWHETLRTR